MPRTKFISEDAVEEEIKNEIKPEATKPAKAKKVFDQSEGVLCRSVVEGSLYMQGAKTQMLYSWTEYGDVSEVEYRDLAAAVRSKSKFVYNPWFIVDDEDFLAEFPQLKKFYDESHTVRDLKRILSLPVNDMITEIKKLPAGAFESLKSIAAKQVSDGVIDSVSKIRALDNLFGTDLNLIGELVRDN